MCFLIIFFIEILLLCNMYCIQITIINANYLLLQEGALEWLGDESLFYLSKRKARFYTRREHLASLYRK